jgi:hypothetical protein
MTGMLVIVRQRECLLRYARAHAYQFSSAPSVFSGLEELRKNDLCESGADSWRDSDSDFAEGWEKLGVSEPASTSARYTLGATHPNVV